MKYAWIDGQRNAYPLPAMCAMLNVSVSGYQAWKRGGTPNRKRLTDAQMLTLIRAIHAEFRGSYGSPRMAEEVRGRGFPASKERVERLMRENGIRARHKRRYKATTDSKHNLPVAPNLLDRNFTPTAPNQVWTADLTYIWTTEGWLYLAVVLDLFNREVVGWSLKPRMTADIVTDALTMAWFRRKPAPGLIHHSDRGSQPEFNRSSQHPNFKELQWVKRNTGGAGEVLAQPLVRLDVRELTLEMSNGASGWRLQRVAQVRRLQLRPASRLLSERAGSGNLAACRTFPFTNLQVDTFLSTSARRLHFFEHEGVVFER